MIIRRNYLTEGLFGQVFCWMLEVLPYIQSQGSKPEWEVLTKNYGEPPTYNIFPHVIRTAYEPEPGGEIKSLEQLQLFHKHNFRRDFRAAQRYWTAFFCLTADV